MEMLYRNLSQKDSMKLAVSQLELSIMAKAKSRLTLVKLVSSAKTGFMRHAYRPRNCPAMTQVRYDPLAMRHVLFTESRKRKIEQKPLPNFRNATYDKNGTRLF